MDKIFPQDCVVVDRFEFVPVKLDEQMEKVFDGKLVCGKETVAYQLKTILEGDHEWDIAGYLWHEVWENGDEGWKTLVGDIVTGHKDESRATESLYQQVLYTGIAEFAVGHSSKLARFKEELESITSEFNKCAKGVTEHIAGFDTSIGAWREKLTQSFKSSGKVVKNGKKDKAGEVAEGEEDGN